MLFRQKRTENRKLKESCGVREGLYPVVCYWTYGPMDWRKAKPSNGEANSTSPSVSPFLTVVPPCLSHSPSLSVGDNVNLTVTEASEGGHAYPDRLDVGVCVCVSVFGVCRLNPASLQSLTTPPSLWLGPLREKERKNKMEKWREFGKDLEKRRKRREQSILQRSSTAPSVVT